jgi:hypothetical protein
MLAAVDVRSEESSEDGEEAPRQQGQGKGYHSFAPKVRGVLYKISPLTPEQGTNVEKYIREGAMKRDSVFVSALFGLVAPSKTKDLSMFWESPWIEDQVKESGKKRKLQQQQRSLAVRSFIKASTQDTSVNVDSFLDKVEKLTQWDQSEDGALRENLQTVSRLVQSFEKKAVLSLLNLLQSGGVNSPIAQQHLNRLKGTPSGDLDPIAHALRRAPHTYFAFASLVASELLLAEASNGSRNISINMSRRMDNDRFTCINTMLDNLQKATAAALPRDTVGLPLMDLTCNVCVSKGVLVVANKRSSQATYVLDIEDLDQILAKRKSKGKKGLDLLEITAQIFEEEEEAEAPKRKRGRGGDAAQPLADLIT